ncbi:MAG: fatty acid desaturase [Thiomonas sp.]|uniref:fatty acid desaturase family protein n=1 Tax=Thiomonas sp. TaxID=2047785 RepID=UPI002A36DF37|nr:fatty acid desaturase [Thiomonas sp.]MDY0331595.1 fatty acid desaturase [Thiomonas sp.]
MTDAAIDPRGIPARLNLLLVALALALSVWLWMGLPMLLPTSPALGWSLLIVVLATTSYWSLLHEGIHAVLLPDRRLNDALSRLLAIGFPAPFAVLRFGHLKHHQFNRTAIDRSEVFDPASTTRGAAAWRYYPQLLIGLYASEVAALLLVWLSPALLLRLAQRLPAEPGLPSLADSLQRQLLKPDTLRAMRLDSLASLALIACSAWLYGPHAWMLLLALLGRGMLISLTDNAYHYATPLHAPGDDVRHARQLDLPRWASALILHFNYHATHHRHPALPWSALPAAACAQDRQYAQPYLRALLRQLRGPIAQQALPRINPPASG